MKSTEILEKTDRVRVPDYVQFGGAELDFVKTGKVKVFLEVDEETQVSRISLEDGQVAYDDIPYTKLVDLMRELRFVLDGRTRYREYIDLIETIERE